MIALLANIASLHPGLHAHPHDESVLDTVIASPWAAVIAGAVLAASLVVVRRLQRD